MPESNFKPHVLFVHGSWHSTAHYEPIRSLFSAAGVQTSCPQLPAIGTDQPIGLKEDAGCIKAELEQLVEIENKRVLVIAHSYGGIVATEAVDARFGKEQRLKQGKDGGVIGIMYMCSFLIPIGLSLSRALSGGKEDFLPPWIVIDEKAGLCWPVEPETFFYHDLPESDQEKYTKLIKTAPVSTQRSALTYAAYMYHPITYLVCEEDKALPPFIQRDMIEKISQLGVEVDVKSCNASHSPYLSMPEKVLEFVLEISHQPR